MSEVIPTLAEIRDLCENGAGAWTGAEFDKAIAAHDHQVKAETWDEAVDWLDEGNDPDQIDMRSANPYRIESQETP